MKAKRRQGATDRRPHEEIGDLLHAYAHETLMGGSPETDYPAVAAHLAECAACRASLDEQLEVTRAVLSTADQPVTDCRQPDLSRLPRPWRQKIDRARPWFVDRVGRLWLEFSEDLLRGWLPSPLLGSARGSLLYTYSGQAGEDDSAKGPADVALKIDVLTEQDPRTALLRITLDLPAQNALDQSGVPITLHMDDIARHGTTDASGTVSFDQVPREALSRMRLEIRVGRSA
jgi:hypothetical protein